MLSIADTAAQAVEQAAVLDGMLHGWTSPWTASL